MAEEVMSPRELLNLSKPAAEKAWPVPAETEADAGLTRTEHNAPAVTRRVAVAVLPPLAAVMV